MASNVAALYKSVAGVVPLVFKGRTNAAATAQSVVFKALVLILNTLTGILTARLLGPEGRGEQAAIILWQGLLAGVLTLGMPGALIYNLKRKPEDASRLFGAAILLSCLFGCVAGLIGVVFIPSWLALYSPLIVLQAQFFMFNTPVTTVVSSCRAALEARGDFAASNWNYLLVPSITMIGLLLLMATNSFSPLTTSLMYIVAPLPINVWLVIRIWRLHRPNFTKLKTASASLLNYGVRSYGIDLLSTMAMQIDQVLVIGFLTPSAMGLYVVALNFSRMLGVFQHSLIPVLFPRIAAKPLEEVVRITGQVTRINFAITFLAAVVMVIFGPFVLYTLYGGEYLEAVPVFNVLIAELLVGGTAWTLAQAFLALNRPGVVTILQGIGLALTVPIMLILLPTYGTLGAALALLCSAIVRLIFVLVSFPLLFKVSAPSLLLKREDIVFLRKSLFS